VRILTRFPTPLCNVGELLNVGFDVQDLFGQVTVVIHLKSTLPRQIHDQRRRLFIVLRREQGWSARSTLYRIATLRDGIPAFRPIKSEFLVPQVRSKIDPHPAVTVRLDDPIPYSDLTSIH